METDLIPYQATSHISSKHALILAPHADDEVFGCGGAILSHVCQSVSLSVVILTDGGRYGDPVKRMEESQAAAAVLQYGEPEFWGLADRALHHEKNLVERLVQKIFAVNADLVYAPSPWEIHPDHRRTASAAVEAVLRTGARLAFYEVGSPLPPNLLLDITPHVDAKKKAMRCFDSQLQQQNYDRQIFSLNQYRTYTLPLDVAAAEAYLLLTSAEIAIILPGLLGKRPVSMGASPSAGALAESLPLVSVLIRSKNGKYLQEALDSVALQLYPHIEVVVIAANPGHPLLPEYCGPFVLKLVSTNVPLRCSQIANKALSEARGEFLLFLDDDDWLLPGHIAKLAHVLSHQSSSLAAYSGIALAGSEGQPIGQVVDLLSDTAHQFACNLSLIPAVLFNQKLLAHGCRFDETLGGHEDWDFCLQMSLQTLFAHVPGISAVHRIRGNSDVQIDSVLKAESTQIIYEKWQALWRIGQAKQFMPLGWFHDDLEKRATEQKQSIVQAEAIIKNQAVIIDQQAREISDLLQSASWKVAAPLRWISIKVKGLSAQMKVFR